MSTRDLGSVTSYAMAVALGFEGTEAEWVTYMMEAGDNAASAASASASATSAEASAETARINYGSPLAASTLSGMTEQNRVYVYTGVEQGMVYNNGVYMGLYTWNLPKDSLYGVDDDEEANAIVQSEGGGYSGANLWRASTMGTKWSDELHDEITIPVAIGFDALLDFVYTSSDATFVSNFSTHFDKQSVIDQYILIYLGCIVDNIGKNQTFFTYDSEFWYGGMYDMDGTWGLPPWNITGWKSAETVFQDDYSAVAEGDGHTTNLLYDRVENLFHDDIVARYQELRSSVLSADNINSEFEKFMSPIPPYLYAEDYASTTGGGNFTDIPLKTTNNILQIRQFVIDRLEYVDSQILE